MDGLAGTQAMAKPRKKRSVPGKATARRLVVQASVPWLQWVEELARFCATDSSKLVDAALIDFAKAKGFPKSRPERTP